MTKLVSVHSRLHKHLKICPKKAESQSAELTTVPVMLSEFLKLAVQFPIVFTKNKDTGLFVCVAMFGFLEKENLFWKGNAWDTLYTPLHIARQPFFLAENEPEIETEDSDQYIVCFDEHSASVRDEDEDGEALFDLEGNETAYLKRVKSLLAELLDGEKKTQRFVNKLLEFELLQSMRLEITFNNGEKHQVNGVYTINEDTLNTLPQDKILELYALGYLGYIYAIITSVGQIYSLIQRKNEQLCKKKD